METIHSAPKQPPLFLPLAPGMSVVETREGSGGVILGVTQAYCVFRLEPTGAVAVAGWNDLALANIRPARDLLPKDTNENDRRNAGAVVLRDLLTLQQFGLTKIQTAARNELLAELCGG